MIDINHITLYPKIFWNIILLFITAVLIAVNYLLMKRYIKMNPFVGFRWLPQAFYSDENWYKINAYGGKIFLIWAIIAAMALILLFFIPVDNMTIVTVLYITIFATLVIPIAMTYNYAKHFKYKTTA